MKEVQTMSDSEMEIMKIIWENGGSVIFAGLLEILEAKNIHWKRTTVQTFLSRLIEKNIVSFKKISRNSEYSALISEEEYLVSQTRVFVQKMYNGNSKGLISALLKHENLTADDIKEINDFWNEGEGIDE